MLKIGFDVDGVLTNLEKYQLKYGKKHFTNVREEDIKLDEIDIKEMFGCTDEEREAFWTKYIWGYCRKEPASRNAANVIRTLQEQGHEIFLITGRAHTTENNITGALFRKMLYNWLEKSGIHIDKDHIVFCSEKNSEVDKLEACKNLKIDIMTDDKKENVMELSKITKVLCYDRKHNQNCEGENITRVYNFDDIYDEIQKLHNKDYFRKESIEEVAAKTKEEKIEYFKRMREYYTHLPYDAAMYARQEKNYKNLCKFGIPLFKKGVNLKIFNEGLVPDSNGILYVSNHNNYYDPFPLIATLGPDKPQHFLTATKMLNMKRGYIYKKTGTVSVDRDDPVDKKMASEELKKILVNGGNTIIYPEGRTNRGEGFLLDFHPGAMAVAQATGCTVVPLAVNDIFNKAKGPLCIRFGEPFQVNAEDNVLEKTEYLKRVIADLKQQNIDYVESYKVKELKK